MWQCYFLHLEFCRPKISFIVTKHGISEMLGVYWWEDNNYVYRDYFCYYNHLTGYYCKICVKDMTAHTSYSFIANTPSAYFKNFIHVVKFDTAKTVPQYRVGKIGKKRNSTRALICVLLFGSVLQFKCTMRNFYVNKICKRLITKILDHSM